MIEYERMKPCHIDGMTEIEKQCFDSGFARKTFERELENRIAAYIVATEHGRVVGYVGAWNICGTVDIMNVGVGCGFRRRGIASELLRHLIEVCREDGAEEINLEVRKSNFAARSLYEKLGFSECGLRRGYYDGKEDAVLMKCVVVEDKADENTCN